MKRVLLIALCGVMLTGCYVTRMALHHNDLFNTRRPVDAVVADPGTPEATREKLNEVERVLGFAQAQGLNTDGAYRYFIQTKEPVVSYIVQAAESDRLEFVTWWFPVVGSVPYIGYFDRSERDAKAAELKGQGYDVNTTGAGAFSSLGWFDDPIFSSMLDRGVADTAHLFLHELAHRTLWIAGSPEFNENLAEYVAYRLVPDYLAESGRTNLIANYEAKLRDKRLFRLWLKDLKDALQSAYQAAEGQSAQTVKTAKAAVFRRFLTAPVRPKFAVLDYVDGEDWNNASVLGASLYTPDLERFARAHKCLGGGPIARFLAALDDEVDKHADAFAALDGLCAER